MTTSTPEFEFLNTQAQKKPENHSYPERAEPSKRCLGSVWKVQPFQGNCDFLVFFGLAYLEIQIQE